MCVSMNDVQVSGEEVAAAYREFESGRVCLSILLKVVVVFILTSL